MGIAGWHPLPGRLQLTSQPPLLLSTPTNLIMVTTHTFILLFGSFDSIQTRNKLVSFLFVSFLFFSFLCVLLVSFFLFLPPSLFLLPWHHPAADLDAFPRIVDGGRVITWPLLSLH